MFKLILISILVLSTTLTQARGRYEAVGTVNSYQPETGEIVINGKQFVLTEDVNDILSDKVDAQGMDSVRGQDLNYRTSRSGGGTEINGIWLGQ